MTLYQYCIYQRDAPESEKNEEFEDVINLFKIATGLNRKNVLNYIIYHQEVLK